MIRRVRKLTMLKIVTLFLMLSMLSIAFNLAPVAADKLEPRTGGTLVVSTMFDPNTWVQIFEPAGVWWAGFNIYDQLVQVDIDTRIKPELAKSWDISTDGLVYTFHLFDNVSWHDGVRFTSADVKFTFEALLNAGPAANGYSYVSMIKTIATPDDYTVVVTLKNPDAGFLYGLGVWMGVTHMIAKHIYEGTDWRTNNATTNHPIGTGPYKFLEYVHGGHYTLVANENYHLGRPYLDKLIYKIIPDVAVQQGALTSGEVGYMMDNPPFSELPGLMSNPNLRVVLRSVGTDQALLIFNMLKPPLDNVKVRDAIAYALNRTEINKIAFNGLCTPATGAYSRTYPGLEWAYNSEAKLPDYNTTKAEELLDEAGYPRGSDGTRFSLTISPAMLWREFEFASLNIKQQLSKVGINVNLEMTDYSSWWDKVHNRRDFDMALYEFYAAPDPFMMGMYLKSGEFDNMMGYNNSRVDELIDLGRAILDQATRKQYYYEIQQHVIEDMPYIYLVEYKWPQVVRKEYHGFFFDDPTLEDNPRIPGTLWDLYGVWWEAGQTITTPPAFPIEWIVVAAVVVVATVVVAAVGLTMRRRKRK